MKLLIMQFSPTQIDSKDVTFPTAAVRGSSPGLVMWDCVVDKVALGQVFSEYFGFPCQSSFHQLLQNHLHLSSGVCAIGQKWPQYQGLEQYLGT
jgi:hypothetical protein